MVLSVGPRASRCCEMKKWSNGTWEKSCPDERAIEVGGICRPPPTTGIVSFLFYFSKSIELNWIESLNRMWIFVWFKQKWRVVNVDTATIEIRHKSIQLDLIDICLTRLPTFENKCQQVQDQKTDFRRVSTFLTVPKSQNISVCV